MRPGPIFATCLALLALTWAFTFERVAYQGADQIQDVVRRNENLALAYEQHTERTLQAIDQAVRYIRFEYENHAGRTALGTMLQQAALDPTLIRYARIIDAQGIVVVSSIAGDAPLDASDRDYFQHHRNSGADNLRIGVPIPSRTDGRPVLHATRRISGPGGAFRGIALVAIDPEQLASFEQLIDLGANGVIQLVGLDGMARVRRHGAAISFGDDMRTSQLVKLAQGSAAGSFVSRGSADGTERLVSYRRLKAYDFIVSLGTSRQESLAGHARRASQLYAAAFAASALIALFGAALLIAARRSARAELARRNEEALAQVEHGITRCLAQARGESDGLQRVLAELCKAKGWQAARYFGLDEQAGVLRCREFWSQPGADYEEFNATSKTLAFVRGVGIGGLVWQSREPLWVPDVRNDARIVNKALARSGIRSAFVFPVLGAGGVVGIVATFSRDVRPPDDRLLRAASVIGSQVEQFLVRNKAQDALAESEARFRQTFELAASGMAHIGLDGRLLRTNRRLCQMLGYTPEELVDRPVRELSHAEDTDATDLARQRVREGSAPSASFEKRYLRKDKSAVWMHVTIALARSAAGAPLYEIAVLEDISERKRQEARIARLSRMHRMLSAVNAITVRVRERDELLAEACRIAVEQGGFVAAWVGSIDDTGKRLVPLASAGAPLGRSGNAPYVPAGATGLALRERRLVYENDITGTPADGLVRERAIAAGARAVVALPLGDEGAMRGFFTLFAPERGFFDEEELRTLREFAGDVAFALDYLEKAERANYLAYYDALTGLPNAAFFYERLTEMLARARRGKLSRALMLVDIERFRAVNASLGRQAGDALLRQVAERLRQGVRGSDLVARAGPDLFAVVVEEEGGEALAAGGRVRGLFHEPFRIGADSLTVGARIGAAIFPADGTDAETLHRNAEAALRQAKRAGEKIAFYAPEMNARAAHSLALENRLRTALREEQFVLHYQPKVDAWTCAIVGLEALIRWQDPERGLVPPGEFIPLMEETGLIVEAGYWAQKRAVADICGWRALGLNVPRVAVNISAIQLRDKGFSGKVAEALAGFGSGPVALDLEITESSIVRDMGHTVEVLRELRAAGVETHIDDFGTGYCSLGYLAKLPVTKLKIDRSFVSDMGRSEHAATLVTSIISLARNLGLKTVAEGVEKEDEARTLARLGCDELQGYLFSRPLAAQGVEALLRGAAQAPQLHIAVAAA